ncbi:TlpA disulfide reductase family protein [Streptomyces sp. URMC 127]|uniref:TlpA disulfide reductase family protein n=1 Tax=Streptomyces sp. URMC 127 TaxID=3423402 RepID=UPI003F1DF426
MGVLAAAIVLVGLVCTLDLVLTLGVVKRLREHTEELARLNGVGKAPVIAVGEAVGDFLATTVDGESLTDDSLTGDTLVAFFSPTCEPCKAKMPKFVEYARALPGGRNQVVATVVGDAEEAAAFVHELSPVARVVVEGHEGALSRAFRAEAYPTVLRAAPDPSGRLVITANDVDVTAEQPAAAAI